MTESMGFAEFFAESSPRVLARALVLAANRHDAEDAVQEAYAEALRRWDRIGRYDAPEAWLHLVVRQRLWKASSRWRRQTTLTTFELDAWRATTGDPEQAVLVEGVLAAVAALPRRQRIMLVMHCLQGMKHHEIADELEVKAATVGAAIFNARRALRRSLDALAVPGHLERLVPAHVVVSLHEDPIEGLLLGTGDWLADRIAAHGQGLDRVMRNVSERVSR